MTVQKPTMLLHDCDIYCEDPRLSLRRAGHEIFVVCPLRSDHFVTLDTETVDEIFDYCMAFLNVEDVNPKGKAMKAAKNAAINGRPFQSVRRLMENLSLSAHGLISGTGHA